jgi:hypothetical protein
MASHLSYLVEMFIGQMVVKLCSLLIVDSVEFLCRKCVLGIYVRYFCEKFNFGMQARFQFFWKCRWILTYTLVFLIMKISIFL